MEVKMFTFPPHGDDRGQLVAIEEGIDLPFDVRRVYYIYDTLPGVRRGFHAHLQLQQILLCVNGSCKIHLDNGYETAEVLLDKPNEGLYISSNMWREMYDFSEGAVLLVLASEHYTEADYIRNYDAFLEMVRSENK
jgi:dTDP-4-dehydrorhamnose 3,5-epimerase-like enzyme